MPRPRICGGLPPPVPDKDTTLGSGDDVWKDNIETFELSTNSLGSTQVTGSQMTAL